jgi:hypothetical protein
MRVAFTRALATVIASGLILQLGRRYYPREIAAAHSPGRSGDANCSAAGIAGHDPG